MSTPSFVQMLEYDYQVRKKTADLLNEGMCLKDALKAAYRDHEVRERHFLTPVMLAALHTRESRPRSRSPRRQAAAASRQQQQSGNGGGGRGCGNGKGGRGGKAGGGKGRGGGGKGRGGGTGTCPAHSTPKGMSARTPDGRSICFKFNTPEGCSAKKCTFVHVCRLCYSDKHGRTPSA